MAMKVYVSINYVDVSSSVQNLSYETTFGDSVSEIDINLFRNVTNSITLAAGQYIEVWRGWTTSQEERIFNGTIESYIPSGSTIKIIAKDKMQDLIRRSVNKTYNIADSQLGKPSEIVKDLVTTYGLLAADSTTIQDSGTAIVLDKFVCNHTDIFERCQALTTAMNWQFYYRSDTGKVYFEPLGYTLNSTILTVGSNVYNVPEWSVDATEIANDINITGAYQDIQTTETGQIGVTSGYTTTSVLLTQVPLSVKVFSDGSNPPTTLKVGGVPNSTTTPFFYYVDKNNKQILPTPATTFTTNNYLQTQYSYSAPVDVHMYIQASIDSYGISSKNITLEDIRTVNDAQYRGTNYLIKYSQPFVYGALKVKNSSLYGLKVGQAIKVIDNISKPAVNTTLVINKLRIRYPSDYDELEVGDKKWRLTEWQGDVQEQIKRLNEKQFDNVSITTEIRTLDGTLLPLTLSPRYRDIYTQTPSGASVFILGDPTYGKLGTQQLGAAGLGSVLTFRQQYGDTFTETGRDSEFVDTTNTSATVSLNSIVLTKNSAQLYERYNAGDDGDLQLQDSVSNAYGQSFTLGNTSTNEHFILTSVKVKLWKTGSPGTVTMEIRDNQNTTNTIFRNTATIDGNTLGGSPGAFVEFLIPTTQLLTAGKSYWIYLYAATSTGSHNVKWRRDVSAPTYTGGSEFDPLDGITWFADTGKDFMFEVYGQKVEFSSLDIDVGNGSIVSCILTATELSGSYEYWINATYNNASFQKITNGALNTFHFGSSFGNIATAGTDLRYAISCLSSGTISDITIVDYH